MRDILQTFKDPVNPSKRQVEIYSILRKDCPLLYKGETTRSLFTQKITQLA